MVTIHLRIMQNFCRFFCIEPLYTVRVLESLCIFKCQYFFCVALNGPRRPVTYILFQQLYIILAILDTIQYTVLCTYFEV